MAGIKAVGIAVLTLPARNRHIRETHCEEFLERFKFSDIAISECNVGGSCCVEVQDVRLNVKAEQCTS